MTKSIKILRTHLHITLRNILESVIVEVKKVGESLSICLWRHVFAVAPNKRKQVWQYIGCRQSKKAINEKTHGPQYSCISISKRKHWCALPTTGRYIATGWWNNISKDICGFWSWKQLELLRKQRKVSLVILVYQSITGLSNFFIRWCIISRFK